MNKFKKNEAGGSALISLLGNIKDEAKLNELVKRKEIDQKDAEKIAKIGKGKAEEVSEGDAICSTVCTYTLCGLKIYILYHTAL